MSCHMSSKHRGWGWWGGQGTGMVIMLSGEPIRPGCGAGIASNLVRKSEVYVAVPV